MKTLTIALAATALTATVASATSVADFDQNGDRFASFAEVTAVNPTIDRNDFRDIDLNRDNRLSATEVQLGEATLNRGTAPVGTFLSTTDISGGSFVSYGELQAAYPGVPTSQLRVIDINKDGRISAVELAAGQADLNVYEAGGSQVVVSLDSIDADGSGFASLAELQGAYPKLTANDLREIDTNRDGRLSFNELYDPNAVGFLGQKQISP